MIASTDAFIYFTRSFYEMPASDSYNSTPILDTSRVSIISSEDTFSLENDALVARKNEHGIRVHKHTLITALVDNPPKDERQCEEWFDRLIKSIDMKIMVPPRAYYCDKDGNRGLTCVAIIETSHITLHAWDECNPGLIELDVFSCKEYDINDVMISLKEFGLRSVNFRCIDRTNGLEEIKLHTVYKTTNLLNGKFYIGVHSDYTGNHSYLGSGIAISNAVKKYGKENFTHEIIRLFNNKDDAYAFEAHLVDYDFVSLATNYNLTPGGRIVTLTREIRNKISLSKKDNRSGAKWITNGSENLFLQPDIAESYISTDLWRYGRTLSKESVAKMNTVFADRGSYHKNKKWYNDGVNQQRYSSTDQIPLGWSPGMISKTK